MARNQRLNATLTIGAALQSSVRRNLDVVGRGLRTVGAEIGTTNQRMRELDRQRTVLVRQGQSVDALDREYRQLNETLRRLEDRQRRLRAVQGALGGVGGAFTQMTGEVTRFARRATIVVGGTAAAIFGLASTTATLGDDVAKTADRLGVGIEALQEYRYAAERTGVGAAAVDSAFETMNRNIGQASMGLGRARRAFSELGLEVSDLAAMPAAERFEMIADALNGVEDETQRSALAAQIFGADIGNLTREGSAGLRELRARARALGFVLSEETARGAEGFADALLDARLGAQGLRNTIGAELMPVVTDVMGEFTDWLVENREPVSDFAQRLGEGLRDAVPVIGQIVTGMAQVSGHIGSGIAQVAEFVGGWERLGAIVGTMFAGRAIMSVLNFGFALGRLVWAVGALVAPTALPLVAAGIRAIGRAIMANPIGLIIGGIALGAALIIQNWESIRPHLQPIFDWFNDALEWARDNVVTPFFGAIERGAEIGRAAWQTFSDGLGRVIDWLGERLQWLLDKLEPILNAGARLREIGSSIGDGAARFNPFSDNFDPLGRRQERAIGGNFLPGAVLVGERGPELRFDNRAGFIATNRQLGAMARRAAQIAAVAGSVGSALPAYAAAPSLSAAASISEAAFGGGRGGAAGGATTIDVGGITINAAAGSDPRAIADAVMRELRRRARGALYDPATEYPGG